MLRIKQQADLLNNINAPLLGLPTVPIPSDNPISAAKIALAFCANRGPQTCCSSMFSRAS
jgi:hypothetical protein